MKKLNVLTRMLLLVALLVGSTSVWGVDETVTKDLNVHREPEYNMSESQVRDLLISWKTNPGSFSFSDSRKICIAYERKIPNSISVFIKPTKVNYQVGDCFDKEGLVILAHYPGNINDEIPCDQFRDYLFTFEPTTDTELRPSA